MTTRTVLVTGAGGFVGSSLVDGFAALGLDVVAFDEDFDEPPGPPVRCVVGALGEALLGGLPAADVVVHAAWVTTSPEALGVTRQEYLALNLDPLRDLLHWSRSHATRAFVFLSSSGVFAPTDGAETLTDADEPTSTSAYAEAKREGERLTWALGSEDGGPPPLVVRLGYLYGPGERARPTRTRRSLVAEWMAAAAAGRPLSVRADDPARDWTFAGDLAAALLRVVDAGPFAGPVHLGAPASYRDSDVASLIAGRFPGSAVTTATATADGTVKPPMAPSDIGGLRDFAWTDLPTGLDRCVEKEVPA